MDVASEAEADRRWLRNSDRYIAMVKQIRETPLIARLQICQDRIGKMCSEGRPPKMTIPMQAMDDDFFINRTLEDAHDAIIEKRGHETADEEAWVRETAIEVALQIDSAEDHVLVEEVLRDRLRLLIKRREHVR